MEEDIKILEELLKRYNSYSGHSICPTEIYEDEVDAIENLIARYKELEEENKELKESELDYTSIYLSGIFDERARWEKRIKEKIEKLSDGSTYDAVIILKKLIESED